MSARTWAVVERLETLRALNRAIAARAAAPHDGGQPVCRTCGFTDCPGARGGDCPRWPQ